MAGNVPNNLANGADDLRMAVMDSGGRRNAGRQTAAALELGKPLGIDKRIRPDSGRFTVDAQHLQNHA